jgi:hypothetical protein
VVSRLYHKASGLPIDRPLLAFYVILYRHSGTFLSSMPEHYKELVECGAGMTREDFWKIILGEQSTGASGETGIDAQGDVVVSRS